MTVKEAISLRKSIRKYIKERLRNEIIEDIENYIDHEIKQLEGAPDCKAELITREQYIERYSVIGIPNAPHYMILSSEKTGDYLENVGFFGQQVILYMVSLGLGTCWIGSSKTKKSVIRDTNKASHIITVAFGKADGLAVRNTSDVPKRIHMHELVLTSVKDARILPVIEAARLAPSAVNMQPVRIYPGDRELHIFRKKPLVSMIDNIQRIDSGIAIANIYTALSGDCSIGETQELPSFPQGYIYVRTITENA